jgi:hypothetical protein
VRGRIGYCVANNLSDLYATGLVYEQHLSAKLTALIRMSGDYCLSFEDPWLDCGKLGVFRRCGTGL